MPPVPFLDLKRQYASLQGEIQAAVAGVLERQEFILGPAVEEFEREAAAALSAPHAVSVASGTDALILCLAALGVGPGDEVLTTPFTFGATAGAIARVGARPVFADIDPSAFNLDPAAARRGWTRDCRALIAVHLFGQCAAMAPLCALARERGAGVVEDAAQAFGARRGGRSAGTLGDLGAFSFYPTKNLGGAGDGGLITASRGDLADRIRSLRAHGQRKERYLYHEIGWNSRLDAIQAAILSVKLKRIGPWNEARREKAAFYDEALSGIAQVRTPRIAPENEPIYHQYVIRAEGRDALAAHLKERGIGHAVFYPLPLHLHPAWRSLGHGEGAFPEAEKAAREVLALPIFPELTREEQGEVVREVREFYR